MIIAAARHNAERERAARAALADHHRDGGHAQPRHRLETGRDRLSLAALLGVGLAMLAAMLVLTIFAPFERK